MPQLKLKRICFSCQLNSFSVSYYFHFLGFSSNSHRLFGVVSVEPWMCLKNLLEEKEKSCQGIESPSSKMLSCNRNALAALIYTYEHVTLFKLLKFGRHSFLKKKCNLQRHRYLGVCGLTNSQRDFGYTLTRSLK